MKLLIKAAPLPGPSQATVNVPETAAAAPLAPGSADTSPDDPLDAFMLQLERSAASAPSALDGAAAALRGEVLRDDDDDDDDDANGAAPKLGAHQAKGRKRGLDDEDEDDDADDAADADNADDALPPPPDHAAISYEPFQRCFFSPAAEALVAARDLGVRVERHGEQGTGVPAPVRSFMHLSLDAALVSALARTGFESPTPIQSAALPLLLAGRNVIGVARTGSGKTLSYVLPLVRHTLSQRALRRGEGPIALVLAPTRELAAQIDSGIRYLCRSGGFGDVLAVTLVTGGSSKWQQTLALRQGAHVVVATPGRLIDHVRCGELSLTRVTFLVFDEADRMLDLGFGPQVHCILRGTRPDRQTALFSATFGGRADSLAREAVGADFDKVLVASGVDEADVSSVVQSVVMLSRMEEKLTWLTSWLATLEPAARVIVFVNSRATVDQVAADINASAAIAWTRCSGASSALTFTKSTPRCVSLHGGLHQSDRDTAVASFRRGDVAVLVATDVASRGLDIPGVTHVVSLDAARDAETHVHRVGRTGRLGRGLDGVHAEGAAITLLLPHERATARRLAAIMGAGMGPGAGASEGSDVGSGARSGDGADAGAGAGSGAGGAAPALARKRSRWAAADETSHA